MPGGLFPRLKTWSSTEDVVYSDLNDEFDNIIDNLVPLMFDDYSVNVTQMQVQTDPGEVGTESLATTLAGELARLRYAINEIKGTSYWYTTASTSLSQLASAIGTGLLSNRISSGRSSSNSSQPLFLVPHGAAATITLKGATTPFVYSIAGTQYTISSDVTITSLTTAPSSNNTCLVDDANLAGAGYTKLVGENGTQITVDTMGSEISALTGKLAAFKTSTEIFLARVESTTALTKVFRGFFFDSTDAITSRVAISNNDTITLLKLSWIFAKTDGTLTVSYTNPRWSGVQPSSPAIGDYWYDMVNNVWKLYNGTSFASAGAVLVGICVQDTSNCIGARSFDFFKDFDSTATAEIIYEGANEIRSRSVGSAISVYGTVIKYDRDFIRWNMSTDRDTGISDSASTDYYMYLKENGSSVISTVAPHDRRNDRRGYYHPAETWRCLGKARNDASSNFQTDVESIYIESTRAINLIGTITAATANYPLPYDITPVVRFFKVDTSGGNYTQVLPPAIQYKGQILRYMKTTSDFNVCTLDGYGSETILHAGAATATVTVATQGEVWDLLSDGSNWFAVNHVAQLGWSSAALAITGTTSNPTKGTPTIDKFKWHRNGRWMEWVFSYNQAAGSGTTGSGDYLITLPNSLQFDSTNVVEFNATVVPNNVNVNEIYMGFGCLVAYKAGATNTAVAIPYDATRYRIAFSQTNTMWSSASAYSLNVAFDLFGSGRFPISGWAQS